MGSNNKKKAFRAMHTSIKPKPKPSNRELTDKEAEDLAQRVANNEPRPPSLEIVGTKTDTSDPLFPPQFVERLRKVNMDDKKYWFCDPIFVPLDHPDQEGEYEKIRAERRSIYMRLLDRRQVKGSEIIMQMFARMYFRGCPEAREYFAKGKFNLDGMEGEVRNATERLVKMYQAGQDVPAGDYVDAIEPKK